MYDRNHAETSSRRDGNYSTRNSHRDEDSSWNWDNASHAAKGMVHGACDFAYESGSSLCSLLCEMGCSDEMDCIERDCIRDYVAERNAAIKASVDSHICGALNVDPTNEIYQASRHYTTVGLTVAFAVTGVYGGVKFLSNINKLAKPVLGSIGHLNAGSNVSKAQKLNRTVIKEYLSNVNKLSREQIICDLESIGLKLKGTDRSRPWMEFIDRRGNVRVKIHPPGRGMDHHHLHIYDRKGNSLNSQLKIVDYDTREAHIIYGEMQ